MKILSTISVLSTLILFASCSTQDIPSSKVPSLVLNTVVEKYPATTEVEWKKVDKQYEAEVKLNDSTDVTYLIDDAGKILQQKEDLGQTGIPAVIFTTIQNNYKDYIVDDVEKLVIGNKQFFQFELEGSGKKDLKLVFTDDGTIAKEIKYWD